MEVSGEAIACRHTASTRSNRDRKASWRATTACSALRRIDSSSRLGGPQATRTDSSGGTRRNPARRTIAGAGSRGTSPVADSSCVACADDASATAASAATVWCWKICRVVMWMPARRARVTTPQAQDRIAAQFEEVIINADPVDPQHLCPDANKSLPEGLLQLARRRLFPRVATRHGPCPAAPR